MTAYSDIIALYVQVHCRLLTICEWRWRCFWRVIIFAAALDAADGLAFVVDIEIKLLLDDVFVTAIHILAESDRSRETLPTAIENAIIVLPLAAEGIRDGSVAAIASWRPCLISVWRPVNPWLWGLVAHYSSITHPGGKILTAVSRSDTEHDKTTVAALHRRFDSEIVAAEHTTEAWRDAFVLAVDQQLKRRPVRAYVVFEHVDVNRTWEIGQFSCALLIVCHAEMLSHGSAP